MLFDGSSDCFLLGTLQIALFFIAVAGMRIHCTLFLSLFSVTDTFVGFGRNVSWQENSVIPPGRRMTYKDALRVVTSGFVLKLAGPSWAFSLTPRLRRVELAFEESHVCR